MANIKIYNNKCTKCGKEVKNLESVTEHYICFENEDN